MYPQRAQQTEPVRRTLVLDRPRPTSGADSGTPITRTGLPARRAIAPYTGERATVLARLLGCGHPPVIRESIPSAR
jgi:hypothetical protein